jgi:hypothetical protein
MKGNPNESVMGPDILVNTGELVSVLVVPIMAKNANAVQKPQISLDALDWMDPTRLLLLTK